MLTKTDLQNINKALEPRFKKIDKKFKLQEKKTDKKMEELTDAILTGMDNIYQDLISKMATKDDIKRLEDRIQNLEVEFSFMKDDIKELKAELATVATKEDISKLDKRIHKLEIAYL